MKLKKLIAILCAAATVAACDTEIEPIDQRFVTPDGQDPAAYAAYVATLKAYKAQSHYTVCALFNNGARPIVSEKDCLRSMPDSLDLVVCMNPLTESDLEDLPRLQEKGTRVLLRALCSDPATAVERVDEAIAALTAHGLDGVAVAFSGPVTDAALAAEAAIAAKLAALDGKMFVFDGNAALVPSAHRDLYAYYLLDATATANVTTLRRDAAYMTGFLGIPAARVLPAVKPFGVISDTENRGQDAVRLVPNEVVTSSLGGLAIYDISADYYSVQGTYPRTRSAIDLLNPAYDK